MSTATVERRLAKANGVTLNGPLACSYRGCGQSFKSSKALQMHVGRMHTHTIPTYDPAKVKRKYKPRKKVSPLRGKPWSAARRARYERKQARVNGSDSQCVITGDGFRLEFSAKFVPTILHTVALSIGGKERQDVEA